MLSILFWNLKGHDTATWSVNIRGNPVHLVTP